jgi:methylthioribulose-1-phosphate dehydratase
MSVPVDEAGRALAAEAARFASFGWMRGTSGNLSLVVSDDPLRLAVTASGKDKGELAEADMVVVDADGQPVPEARGAGPGARPSAEAALHARVARVTGARAVVHVHTVASVVASRRWPHGVTLSDLEMIKGIGRATHDEQVRLPVIANSQDMVKLGDSFEDAYHPAVPAVIVAGHGLYAWGESLLRARHHTEVVQWMLEVVIALPES